MAGEKEYVLGLDLTKLRRDAEAAKAEFRSIGSSTIAENKRMKDSFDSIGRAVTGALSVAAITQFGREVIRVTGQFQTFQAVLTNTLGDAGKAKASMEMIQEFAATTPFQVDALTGAFVKLANMGFVPTMQQMTLLGDLASSTGKGFDQLTEAIIDAQTGEFERLKEFGIRASKEGDNVTFTFKEQQTQVDFTASSIREYILSLGELKGVQGSNAAIAATLTGQISNLEDGITQMMNEIGQSSSGVIFDAVSGAAFLVEHYEEIGRVLVPLIATYGAYRAAVMLVNAAHKVMNIAGTVRAFMQLTTAVKSAKDAQILLNLATKANPYVLLVSTLVAVGTALWAFSGKAKDTAKELTGLNKAMADAGAEFDKEASKVKSLQSIVENGNIAYSERKKALNELKGIIPGYNADLSTEGVLINNNTTAIKEYLVQFEKQIKLKAAQEELEEATRKKIDLDKKLPKYEANYKKLRAENPNPTVGSVEYIEIGVARDLANNAASELEDVNKIIQEINKEIETSSKSLENAGGKDTNFGEDYKAAKKTWQDAKKTYDAILKDRENYTTKAFEDAKAKKEEAEKAFKALGGITSANKLNPITEEDKAAIEGSIAWYEEQISLLQDKRKTLTDATEINKVDLEIEKHETSIDGLNAESKKRKDKADEIKAEEARIRAEKEAYAERLKNFQTFAERYQTLKEQHEENLEFIKQKGGSTADVDAENQRYDEEVMSVNNEAFDTLKSGANIIAQVFDDTAKRTNKQINTLRTQTEELMAYLANTKDADITAGFGMSADQLKTLKANPDQLKAISEALDELYEKGSKQNPFAQLATDAKNLFSKGGFDIGNIEKFSSSLNSVTGMVTNITGGLKEMFEASGNEKGAAIVGGIEEGLTAVSNIASGFAQGGIIGGAMAAVGELIKGFTKGAQVEAEHQAKLKEIRESNIAQQEAYNQLLREQNLLYEDGNNLLSKDAYGTATNAIAQAKKDAITLKADIAKLGQVDIETGSYTTGVMWWKKQHTIYTDLLALYPRLVDANGQLDTAMAQTILDTRNLSDAHRQLLEDAIESQEAFEESIGVMRDYLEDTFGGMGNQLSDSLVDAFKNGEDAADAFGDTVNGMIENMVSDLVYSAVFADLFNDASKDISRVQTGFNEDGTANKYANMGDEEKLTAQMGILSGLMDGVEGKMNEAEMLLEWAKQEGQKRGLDDFMDSSDKVNERTSASSSGITASQDSVNSVDGRLTVMQGHTFTIADKVTNIAQYLEDFAMSALYPNGGPTTGVISAENDNSGMFSEVKSIGNDMRLMRENTGNILKVVTGIKGDTARLGAIEGYMGEMKSSIESIQNKGVRLRT